MFTRRDATKLLAALGLAGATAKARPVAAAAADDDGLPGRDPFGRPIPAGGEAVTPRAWHPDQVVDFETFSLHGHVTNRGIERGPVVVAPHLPEASRFGVITVSHRGGRWWVDVATVTPDGPHCITLEAVRVPSYTDPAAD